MRNTGQRDQREAKKCKRKLSCHVAPSNDVVLSDSWRRHELQRSSAFGQERTLASVLELNNGGSTSKLTRQLLCKKNGVIE